MTANGMLSLLAVRILASVSLAGSVFYLLKLRAVNRLLQIMIQPEQYLFLPHIVHRSQLRRILLRAPQARTFRLLVAPNHGRTPACVQGRGQCGVMRSCPHGVMFFRHAERCPPSTQTNTPQSSQASATRRPILSASPQLRRKCPQARPSPRR